jgi:hypothetical protein
MEFGSRNVEVGFFEVGSGNAEVGNFRLRISDWKSRGRISDVSAAAGLENGQSNRKRNSEKANIEQG